MSLRELPLEAISCELFSPSASAGAAALDCDQPLLVIEEEGKFFLVDGFKRYFTLKERGALSAWVIVKAWSRVEAKIERLKRNNPARRTSLREELDIISELYRKAGFSERALIRSLGKKSIWVKRRLEILRHLSPEVPPLLPERLFRVTVAQAISKLPTAEQVAVALALSAAGLNLTEAIRFLRLFEVAGAPERARLRADPRSALAALEPEAVETPAEKKPILIAVHKLFDEAVQEAPRFPPRLIRPLLDSLHHKVEGAILTLENSSALLVPASRAAHGSFKTQPPIGGVHDTRGDPPTDPETLRGGPQNPLDCPPLKNLPQQRARDCRTRKRDESRDRGGENSFAARSLQGSG